MTRYAFATALSEASVKAITKAYLVVLNMKLIMPLATSAAVLSGLIVTLPLLNILDVADAIHSGRGESNCDEGDRLLLQLSRGKSSMFKQVVLA